MTIDNIVVGETFSSLEDFGVLETETTIHIPVDAVRNEEGQIFLPHILKEAGLFQSTSQIKQINNQRLKSQKFKDDPNQNLWRVITKPEMTPFKIGKNVFWLIIGAKLFYTDC